MLTHVLKGVSIRLRPFAFSLVWATLHVADKLPTRALGFAAPGLAVIMGVSVPPSSPEHRRNSLRGREMGREMNCRASCGDNQSPEVQAT